MTTDILGALDNWRTQLEKERIARATLAKSDAPAVIDLQFRKQNSTAVVFEGLLDGEKVFLKHYQTDHGSTVTRRSVEETGVVQQQMDGVTAGIAEIIWASEERRMILMACVDGRPVSDALSDGHVLGVMPQVVNWLTQYVGPRSFQDTFSTSYWSKSARRLMYQG